MIILIILRCKIHIHWRLQARTQETWPCIWCKTHKDTVYTFMLKRLSFLAYDSLFFQSAKRCMYLVLMRMFVNVFGGLGNTSRNMFSWCVCISFLVLLSGQWKKRFIINWNLFVWNFVVFSFLCAYFYMFIIVIWEIQESSTNCKGNVSIKHCIWWIDSYFSMRK